MAAAVIPDRDLVAIRLKDSAFQGTPMSRAIAERMISSPTIARDRQLVPVPTCLCCGEPAWDNLRCTKHQDRNPCVVEGCRKTCPAKGWLRNDAMLCGEHWRAFVPPGSPIRQAFNRLGRIARRAGFRRHDRWPDELQERRWRLWCGVVRRIRRGPPEGHIDQKAIERLFGWDDDGG